MNKKMNWFLLGLCLGLGILLLGFVLQGCGTTAGTDDDSTAAGDYTVSGIVGTVSASGLSAAATDTVTHIVAIGADNNKTVVTPESSDDTFSLSLTSGQPYVLGFFNVSDSTITLLGYLKRSDYDWDSLPVIDPTDSATDLGTVEIVTASVEATPAINISSLISEMNMDVDTATLYGVIDDSLAALTNLDLDSNGVFDFDENKNYLFQTYIGMFDDDSPAIGEVDSMFDGYNDTYTPVPTFYQIYFSCISSGDTRTLGTSATLTPPSAIGGESTQTATTGANSDGDNWTLFFPSISTTPTVAPSGTYTIEIGSTTYTIENFKGSDAVAIGSNNNLIYPVFHLVSTESTGKITTVQYLWKKLESGTIVSATAAEVLASINYDASDENFLTMNPFISFFSGQNTLIEESDGTKFYYLTPTPADLDVSGLDITSADIDHIQAGYELTSKVICKFDLY
ncbi:hypothetical protein ACFL5U_00720 [Candidatus Margulisiibacteriota bacterium]